MGGDDCCDSSQHWRYVGDNWGWDQIIFACPDDVVTCCVRLRNDNSFLERATSTPRQLVDEIPCSADYFRPEVWGDAVCEEWRFNEKVNCADLPNDPYMIEIGP